MKYLSIGEAAASLGIAVSTLRRWEKEGKLIPHYRTVGNHRRYSWPQLQALINPEFDRPKKTVCYARVSSHDQKDDLQRQAVRLIGVRSHIKRERKKQPDRCGFIQLLY